MSNRDSLGFGELLPQDVVEIFAHEKQGKNGRKKRSRSLGRALGWLKGKKKKDLGSKGQNLGLGPALDLALDGHPAGHKGGHKSGKQAHTQGNSHAVPKRDDDDGKTPAPPLFQENVFIETSRPKYLEDLHTEALEGLKMMQQEETNIGGEYQDNESTISMLTVQTDGEGGGFVTDSTIPDTSSVVSMQSSASTKSSRSGLTRQGSTFRPLNSGKKSEKSKMRRRHRKTVAGIPHHVQKELGLDRVGWTLAPKLDEEQLYNGESDYSSTTEGPLTPDSPDGAISSLQATNVIHPLSKDKVELLNAAHAARAAGHRDDLALLHHLGPGISGEQRPRSLAVPWMTTSLQQEPPSPVMSMSPQAAYMSKIIPNAVLPPSIDVVEISRGRSRNSVRTVSKSSLVLSSPAPSRASSRASSSRTTSTTITSASRHNYPNMSDSNWSNSESSDTLVSDSSTISTSSTPRQKKSQDGDASAKEDKVSLPSKSTSNGKLMIKGDDIKEGQFARSLSVMKAKRAPPPPSRSYSLHNKMKRRSRDLAEVKIISGEPALQSIYAQNEENEKYNPGSSPVPSRIVDSPGYNADTSSLDDSASSASLSPLSQLHVLKTDVKKVAETISEDASQEKQEQIQKNKLNKTISPSSGYSSKDDRSPKLSKQPVTSSPRQKKGILAKLQRLFPGSTSAGSASSPPTQPKTPESAKSTGEAKPNSVDPAIVSPSVQTLRALFNIPPHPKVHAPPPPPPDVWAHSSRSIELILGPPAPGNTYSIVKKNPKDRRQQRQSPPVSAEGSVKSLVVERKQKIPAVESVNGSLHVLETKKVQESEVLIAEMHKENTERLAQNVDLNGNGKEEKVRASDILNGMLVKAVEKRKERLAAKREEEAVVSTQATEIKTTMDTLPAISLVRISPPPVLAHHPVPPLSTETADIASVTTVVISQESSWPPPPPPAQVTLVGPDELDFPLPPPPLFAEKPILPVQLPPDGDSSCRTASVVVKTESVKVITGAESQKPTTSQETPLNIPPPPPYSAPPPPTAAVFHPTVNKVLPPPIVSLPPPKEFSPTPPPPPPPPPAEVLTVRPKDSSAPVAQDVIPLVKDISPTLVTIVAPSPVKHVSPPLVIEVTPPPARRMSNLPPDHVPPPPPQDVASRSAEEVQSVSRFALPQSIPPPPPLASQPQSTIQKIIILQESIPLKPDPTLVSSNSILAPPQSIPAPPPIELLHQAQDTPLKSDGQATEQAAPSPPSEASVAAAPEKAPEPTPSPPINIPLPPPLPVQGLASIKHQLSQLSTQNQSQEQTSAPVVHEEPTPIVTQSLLQMVKLRSVNSSPEPPKAQEPPQAEVIMRKQQPNNQVPTSSPGGEPPQKPIRRSLIVTSPTSTSPPALVISPVILPQSQTVMNQPQETSTVVSPEEKSPAPSASVVVPPASSSTLVSSEKNPPEMTTTTAVVVPPVSTFTVISPEEKSPEMKTTASVVVPPASSSTLVSSEKNLREMTTTASVVVPPVSTFTVISPEKNPPEMTTTTAVVVPPASSSTLVSPEEKSPEMTTASVVVPPASSSTLVSSEKNPPEMTTTTAVVVTPASSSTLVSSEEKSPPEMTTTTAVEVPPVSSSTLVSSEKNPPEMTTTASLVVPPASSSTLVSPEEKSPEMTVTPSIVVPPVSSSTLVSPEKKSPPEMTATPSIVVPPVSSSTVISPEKKSPEMTATPSVMVPPTSSSTVISPMKTSPPATTVIPFVVLPPVSSSPDVSPVKKSPPAMTAPHSMNLQEAIRLRTAARSKAGPASRLSLHSPTSPSDFRKSPTSTASFIFSKSNKRVVIETKPALEAKGDVQKNSEVSSVAKVISETESLKKGIKVPPPVAKKPKTKGKEVETSERTEQTAGQEAQQEVVRDGVEKTNGTAGTVEGEGMAQT